MIVKIRPIMILLFLFHSLVALSIFFRPLDEIYVGVHLTNTNLICHTHHIVMSHTRYKYTHTAHTPHVPQITNRPISHTTQIHIQHTYHHTLHTPISLTHTIQIHTARTHIHKS